MQFKPFQGPEHQPFVLEGGKPAALLIHGFPGTPAEMRPLAEVLHRAGWTTQGILLPGFGADLETLPTRTAQDWLRAARDAYAVLAKTHKPLLIVGNSVGGALTLQLCAELKHNAPQGIVLLAPFWRIDHALWTMLPILRRVFPQIKPFQLVKPDFKRQEMREGIRNFMPDADLDDPQVQQAILDFTLPLNMFAELRSVGERAYRTAHKVKTPALILQGAQDTLVRPITTRRLMQKLRGSVRYLELPGGHDLFKPELAAWSQVEKVVREFAEEITKDA
jgi:carboxylesterase